MKWTETEGWLTDALLAWSVWGPQFWPENRGLKGGGRTVSGIFLMHREIMCEQCSHSSKNKVPMSDEKSVLKTPWKILTCKRSLTTCVCYCVWLPLELAPKLGLQLTKYRCGFSPNTTQKQGSQLQMKWLTKWAKNTVLLKHHASFLCSLNTQLI